MKLGALGDVLRTTTCVEPLKARYPRAHITWLTRPESSALLRGNPAIDRVLTTGEGYFEMLSVEEFDLAIGPDADILSASIMSRVRAGEKKGFVADGRGGVLPLGQAALEWWRLGVDDGLKRANRRTYGEWLYDICGIGAPVCRPSFDPGSGARANVSELLQRVADGATQRICVNTGASSRWREKRWKAVHYRELAGLILEQRPNAALVLIGGPEEEGFNRQLLDLNVGFLDGGTGRSFEEVGALMAACDWVITPDSLGYHLACAVGTPAVCLVGPTSPWELDRYGENLVLHSAVPCISCYLAECPLPRTCMDMLTAREVWERILAWPPAGGAPAAPVAADPVRCDQVSANSIVLLMRERGRSPTKSGT